MSNFEQDKLKASSIEEEILEEETDEEDSEEIEVDTEMFAEGLVRFPCFESVPKEKNAEEIFDLVFEAYQDENLLEEQDHVVELLLHLQDEESPFNLSRALEVWSHDDRQAFLELVDELCQEADEHDAEESVT
jgi:hypothetical protein